MMPTYPAILRNDRIEWTNGTPPGLGTGPVEVQVTVLKPTGAQDEDRGQRILAILERLAARGTLSEITDPGAWQREQRKDRPLPGRDE